ncbi:MAG: hypothetical protein A2X64_06590 [Ignavibacteria bacterium GWF2_33_9]|nr:MAG: hypothetical protein A2X64_06590 [Ignavibacteria bacterium GWF2_33_9]
MKNKTNFVLENTKINSILIIRLSSIGDIVLTTHFIRNLRIKYPDANIDFITFENFNEILKFNPRLNRLFSVNKSELKSNKLNVKSSDSIVFDPNSYDLIVDLQKNKYSKNIIGKSSAKIFRINKHRLHKLSLVYLKKSLINNYSIPLNYSIPELKIGDDGLGLEFWLEKDELNILSKIEKHDKLNISFAPGAAHKTKQLPVSTIIEVMMKVKEKYNCTISLLGGKSEIELGKQIENQLNFNIQNFCGNLTLQETASKINTSDLLITNDTGLMHIAAARQVPIITFFGSSVRELGFEPFRVKNKIIEKDLWCRPCSHIGRSFCPLGHFRCMKSISVVEILDSINEILEIQD